MTETRTQQVTAEPASDAESHNDSPLTYCGYLEQVAALVSISERQQARQAEAATSITEIRESTEASCAAVTQQSRDAKRSIAAKRDALASILGADLPPPDEIDRSPETLGADLQAQERELNDLIAQIRDMKQQHADALEREQADALDAQQQALDEQRRTVVAGIVSDFDDRSGPSAVRKRNRVAMAAMLTALFPAIFLGRALSPLTGWAWLGFTALCTAAIFGHANNLAFPQLPAILPWIAKAKDPAQIIAGPEFDSFQTESQKLDTPTGRTQLWMRTTFGAIAIAALVAFPIAALRNAPNPSFYIAIAMVHAGRYFYLTNQTCTEMRNAKQPPPPAPPQQATPPPPPPPAR